jgi:hypothetical protein
MAVSSRGAPSRRSENTSRPVTVEPPSGSSTPPNREAREHRTTRSPRTHVSVPRNRTPRPQRRTSPGKHQRASTTN